MLPEQPVRIVMKTELEPGRCAGRETPVRGAQGEERGGERGERNENDSTEGNDDGKNGQDARSHRAQCNDQEEHAEHEDGVNEDDLKPAALHMTSITSPAAIGNRRHGSPWHLRRHGLPWRVGIQE